MNRRIFYDKVKKNHRKKDFATVPKFKALLFSHSDWLSQQKYDDANNYSNKKL